MKGRWLGVAALISLGVFASAASGSVMASAPSCSGSVNGDPLSGPSNVGIPGVWLQGDPQVAGILDCTYHQNPDGSGQQYDVEVAWVTAKSADPPLYGCGQTPTDPTTTFVSAKFEAYGHINFAAAPPLFAAASKALLAEVESGLAKPCTSTVKPPTAPLPTSVTQTPQYRALLGLDDPSVSITTWLGQTVARCNDLISRAKSFPGANSNGNIPGETRAGTHSDALIGAQGDFHNLLDAIVPLNKAARKSNVFRAATLGYEPALQAAILGSEGNLEPADVLYYALKVTHGSYPLAVLTAHNLLKDATFMGRDAIARGANPDLFAAKHDELMAELQPAAALASKLVSLRRDPAASRDKLGPWYHAFAILSIGAFWHPIGGLGAFAREHSFKLLGFFRGSEASFNLEKAGTDYCFATAAVSPTLIHLAR